MKTESDFEYIQHIQTQLAFHKERLLKLKMGLVSLPAEDMQMQMHVEEEKVILYEELLEPLKQSILVEIDNIYVPRSVGVISHWPWYNFLKDWLVEVIQMQRGNFNYSKSFAPIERYKNTTTCLSEWSLKNMCCAFRCVINLVHEIPLPPPGKLEIVVKIGDIQLYCSRPPVNTISVLKNVPKTL